MTMIFWNFSCSMLAAASSVFAFLSGISNRRIYGFTRDCLPQSPFRYHTRLDPKRVGETSIGPGRKKLLKATNCP
jgi:hypothetical protein